MLVKASLELPGFSTLDVMASQICTEVYTALFERIVARISLDEARTLAGPLEVVGPSRTTAFNRLKQIDRNHAQSSASLVGAERRAWILRPRANPPRRFHPRDTIARLRGLRGHRWGFVAEFSATLAQLPRKPPHGHPGALPSTFGP